MNVRILRSVAEVRSISAAWDLLQRTAAPGNPFLSSAWTLAWLANIGTTPFVLAAFDASRLVGVLPLTIDRRRAMFVEGDAFGFVADGDMPNVIDLLVGALASRSGEWDVAELNELLDEAPTTGDLKAACERSRLSWSATPTSGYPYVELVGDEAAYEQRVGKKVVKEIQRRQRQLEQLGRARFIHVTTRSGLLEHFPAIVALHKKRWEDRSDTSAFTDERRTKAMLDAALSFADAGQLSLDLLFLDNALIAFSYGFVVDGRHIYYSPGFDPAYAPYSVSKILLYWQLRECRQQHLREFDFSRGEETYKLVWATNTRRASTILIGHQTFRSQAATVLREQDLRARTWLKQQPRTVHFKRVTLGRIRHAVEPATLRRRAKRLEDDVRRSIGDRGITGTMNRAFERLSSPIHSHVSAAVYERPLPLEKPASQYVTIALLSASEFCELERTGRYQLDAIVKAYYSGSRCYVARADGHLAAYTWTVTAKSVFVPELNRELEVAKDQLYLYDCYTLPPFRGRGLYPMLLQAVASQHAKGYRKALIVVEAANPSSIRGVEKAGFTLAALVNEHRWLRRKDEVVGKLRVP